MTKLMLTGCRSNLLAGYLKAVGIHRILHEQKDPKTKGWWQNGSYVIETELSQEQLCVFFSGEYVPTPIVAPWQGGSGFYAGDDMTAIDAILSTTDARFKNYKSVILDVRSWPEIPSFEMVEDIQKVLRITIEGMRSGKSRDEIEITLSNIESTKMPAEILHDRVVSQLPLTEIENLSKKKGNPYKKDCDVLWKTIKKARTQCNTLLRSKYKDSILPRCRARLPESCLPWLDALGSVDIESNVLFNPVLGTGGNEGRLNYSKTFMQQLNDLLINGSTDDAVRLFHSAAFETLTTGLSKGKIGQYDPGRAGGYNQGMGIETKNFKINSWDFVLAMEGALVLAGSIVRRNPTDDRSHFTIPFTVRFSPVGFSSSSQIEAGQYETWLPIWRNPASYPEIQYLFGESRNTIGRRVAKNAVEFSRAAGTLGVDRGIHSFERYAFLERRGQSKVALPAGRIKAQYKPELEYLDEFDAMIKPAQMLMRVLNTPPASLMIASNNIDKSLFECTQKADPRSFNNLIRNSGKLEKIFATQDRSKNRSLNRPLSGLSPNWIGLCDDGSIEVRIAAALASIHATEKVGPIRCNMAGVDPLKPWLWNNNNRDKTWHGSSFKERLAGVLSRRLMDAQRLSTPIIPLEAYIELQAQDIMSFLWHDCDDQKIEELLWGFTLINWKKKGVTTIRNKWKKPLKELPLSRAWCLLKLLHSPYPIHNSTTGQSVNIRKEPRIAQLLTANRLGEAYGIARHRLLVSGLAPYDVIFTENHDNYRLLGSLLMPVKNQMKLERLVLGDKIKDNDK